MSFVSAVDIDGRLADLVWRAWRSMGAPTRAEPLRVTIIDPEALVVLTAWIARDGDDRMMEVAADWCRDNHGLLQLLRLRRLVSVDNRELAASVRRLVEIANGSDVLADGPLRFTSKPSLDTGASARVRLGDPAMLRMRLRSLMGPTARAEALTALLCQSTRVDGLSTSDLARSTLFGQRHLREALNDLAYGSWITRWRAGARDYRYTAAEQSLSAFDPIPDWTDWTALVPALIALSQAARALQSGSISDVAAVITGIEGVTAQLRSLGVTAPDWYAADTPHGIERISAWLDDTCERLTRVE